jgi:hypothetical protein
MIDISKPLTSKPNGKSGMSTGMKFGIGLFGLFVIFVLIVLYNILSDVVVTPPGATPAGATPAGATPAGATPAGATPAGAASGATPAGTESTTTAGSTTGSASATPTPTPPSPAQPEETEDQRRDRLCSPLAGCNNHGSCSLQGDVATCDCDRGYLGDFCQEERCRNGGSYNESTDSCDCIRWRGENCQIEPVNCDEDAGVFTNQNTNECESCRLIPNKADDPNVFLMCTSRSPPDSYLSGPSGTNNLCRPGYWYQEGEIGVSSSTCQRITVCDSDKYESTAPTSISDRVCSALSSCGENEYISQAGGTETRLSSDNVCLALTSCNSIQYESLAPTATSNRVCSALTDCSGNQYESVAATATSNRQCANKKSDGQTCSDDTQCTSGDCDYENWMTCNNAPCSGFFCPPRCTNMACR